MAYQLAASKDNVELQISSEDDLAHLEKYRNKTSRKWKWVPTIMSCLLNLVLAILLVVSRTEAHIQADCSQESTYAHLEPDIFPPIPLSTEYSSENLEIANDAWERLSFDSGLVALDNDYIEAKGLPASQPFPWDPSKSLYLLNGYHSLHCVKTIREALYEWNFNKPQTYDFEHLMHCIDSLRIETMCRADDTPRYSTTGLEPITGIGQHRQCRSWEKLESWAQQHTACYRYLNYSLNFQPDQLQRFVFCPPDSPYYETVQRYLKRKENDDIV